MLILTFFNLLIFSHWAVIIVVSKIFFYLPKLSSSTLHFVNSGVSNQYVDYPKPFVAEQIVVTPFLFKTALAYYNWSINYCFLIFCMNRHQGNVAYRHNIGVYIYTKTQLTATSSSHILSHMCQKQICPKMYIYKTYLTWILGHEYPYIYMCVCIYTTYKVTG